MWDETARQNDGTIKKETKFPINMADFIIAGPHFYVANPLFKTANEGEGIRYHSTIIDLATAPDQYMPRTNYTPNCTSEKYYQLTQNVPWDTEKKVTDFYRLIFRRQLSQSGERTMIPSILPKNAGHIHPVNSFTFKNPEDLLTVGGACMSLPYDFIIKSTGKSDLYESVVRHFPLLEGNTSLKIRTLSLNCLTTHYADLWSECWNDAFHNERWYSDDLRLDSNYWNNLTPKWQRNCALRSDYARRWALLELDVLVARELKLTLVELQMIYRVQFPVLQQNEGDTWYDQNGRIVFTVSKGLPGVGFTRKEWDEIKEQPSATRTVTDTTLPTGPVERTIEYTAPFTRCNREDDYALVWSALDAEASKEV